MEAAEVREKLLDAALVHVPFDGWSDTTFRAALADSGQEPTVAQALFPRGGPDLALAYHARGDREMARQLAAGSQTDAWAGLRFRERVIASVMLRLSLADREAVRRGTALFALPQHAGDGARAIWGTADTIWTALGDTSDDINWYSKRASLSAVYGATVLYWLGDDSPEDQATRDFLSRRVEDVMRFEKAKAAFLGNPLGKALAAGPLAILSRLHAPRPESGLPGGPPDAGPGPRNRPF